METTQDEALGRLLKHAYLYATFSDQDPQGGAVLVKDDAIIGMGWAKEISSVPVSEIEDVLLTCRYYAESAMLVCPMPPCFDAAAFIITAEVGTVVYHKYMLDQLTGAEIAIVDRGLQMLKEHDIDIIEYDGPLNLFNIKFHGKMLTP